jgi:hypothetical protein
MPFSEKDAKGTATSTDTISDAQAEMVMFWIYISFFFNFINNCYFFVFICMPIIICLYVCVNVQMVSMLDTESRGYVIVDDVLRFGCT